MESRKRGSRVHALDHWAYIPALHIKKVKVAVRPRVRPTWRQKAGEEMFRISFVAAAQPTLSY